MNIGWKPLMLPMACLLCLAIKSINADGRNTFTCEGGHFTAGKKASITCNFHRDVSELKNYHYYVAWYPNNTQNDNKGIEVLACFKVQSGKFVCREKEGFKFNGTINDRLTLQIPNVTSEFAGRYSCQYVPPEGEKIEMCSLTVEGVAPGKEGGTDSETGVAPGKEGGTDSETDISGSEEIYKTAVIYVSVLLGLAFFITLVALIVITSCRPRREASSRNHPEQGGQEEHMMPLVQRRYIKGPHVTNNALDRTGNLEEENKRLRDELECLKNKQSR